MSAIRSSVGPRARAHRPIEHQRILDALPDAAVHALLFGGALAGGPADRLFGGLPADSVGDRPGMGVIAVYV